MKLQLKLYFFKHMIFSLNKEIFHRLLLILSIPFLLTQNSCVSKSGHRGVYQNIDNATEYLVLYKGDRYAHFIKSDTGYIKVNISHYSVSKDEISFAEWKSFNFEFEIKNYPNGVSSDARITGNKISFLWAIDNPIDDFIKTNEKLPPIEHLME